jgi:5-methylcytosine-specific restriction endonuclease McrA
MADPVAEYKGHLSEEQRVFLNGWKACGLELKNTGSGKTLRILRDGQNLAYVNNTVYQHRSLIGFHFLSNNADPCPPELLNNLSQWACERFACASDEIDIYNSNDGCTYLHVKTVAAALRALERPVLADIEAIFTKGVQTSQEVDAEVRQRRLQTAPKVPKCIEVVTYAYLRNPDVVVEVLLRAKGKCESCRRTAPFVRRSDNSPYLEVHHRIPLANGGEDTVENAEALCPNCHRARHYG